MNNLEKVTTYYPDMDFLSADGFENAIIGISGEKLVYSKYKCLKILMSRDDMNYEEAEEYFSYNVEGAYVGEKTPIWVDDGMFN